MSHEKHARFALYKAIAVAGLLLTCCGCGGASSGEPGVFAVAVAGEHAPGLDEGYLFEGIKPNYSMGASGHVAFVATANIQNGGPRERKEGLWFGKRGKLAPVLLLNEAVDGLDKDTKVASIQPLPIVVTQSGQVGLAVGATNASSRTPRVALLVYDNERFDSVIAVGDDVPTHDGEQPLLQFGQFAMTDNRVLFTGTYGRRQFGIWYWDGDDIQLVAAPRVTRAIGDFTCEFRTVAATEIELNRQGQAVFRASLGGNECPRGGTIMWDADSGDMTPVAFNQTPIAKDSTLYHQAATGDARISDKGDIVIHSKIYSVPRDGYNGEMMVFRAAGASDSIGVMDKNAAFANAPDLSLTHVIHGSGMAVISSKEAVHFVKSNRNRIIARTNIDDLTHTVLAQTGTSIDQQTAARIGNAQVNREGDTVFTAFIDDGPQGGQYQQELWQSSRGRDLQRLAFVGKTVDGRDAETIDQIDTGSQSYEPTMQSTQGGRSRRMSDDNDIVFAGRLRKGSQWHYALFIASW